MTFLLPLLLVQFALAAPPTVEDQLVLLRNQVSKVENELLSTKTQALTAQSQLKKIKQLLELQKKEIKLSESRVKELSRSFEALSQQKLSLLEKIERQKKDLHARLRALDSAANTDALSARWIRDFDMIYQKEAYLSAVVKKDVVTVTQLKQSADEAQALELRLIEEKGRIDYYILELKEQHSMMAANEQVQRDIILTNRASRLETLKNLRELKQAEKELSGMFAKLSRKQPATGAGLLQWKGKLPFPVDGNVVGNFGRSYNPKTNLFTFLKGVTIDSKSSASVKAVASGKVAYSGPLKNYGSIVIMEHTGQYYTLYGQLGNVLVKEGQELKQGEVVGMAAQEPVYFEIRNKNIAVNPMQWLSKNPETKRGS